MYLILRLYCPEGPSTPCVLGVSHPKSHLASTPQPPSKIPQISSNRDHKSPIELHWGVLEVWFLEPEPQMLVIMNVWARVKPPGGVIQAAYRPLRQNGF